MRQGLYELIHESTGNGLTNTELRFVPSGKRLRDVLTSSVSELGNLGLALVVGEREVIPGSLDLFPYTILHIRAVFISQSVH